MIIKVSKDRSAGLLVDLLMIVIGINVALWFEGWFEDQKDGEAEQQYLLDLREDLLADVASLDKVIAQNKGKIERVSAILPILPGLAVASADSQSSAIFEPPSYQFFYPSDATYRSMMESGDFRLLSDAKIKKKILRLSRRWQEIEVLQKNFLQALDDVYIPLMMRSFDIAGQRITDPAIVENQSFKNFFMYTIQDTSGRVRAYEYTRKQCLDLLEVLPDAVVED
jgi:hypothetical protein